MGRKTTAYARRCRRLPLTNGAAWLNTIAECRPYSDDVLPGSWIGGTQIAATRTKAVVRGCFDRLKAGTTPALDTDDIDTLSHALGVSCIRAGQIAGEDAARNEMLPPLIRGNQALRTIITRRRKWGKWELLPAEVETIDWALEIYETILQASSPTQMVAAVRLRNEALQGQVSTPLDAIA